MSNYLHFLVAAAKHGDPKARPMPVSYMTGKSGREIIHLLYEHYGVEHMDKAEELLKRNYPRFFEDEDGHLAREDLPPSDPRQ